ncbi:hypothetical protein ACWERY_22370 [Streptomyces sp. NPDC004082]|uniref:hypothetical protein n=1 Tax=unclassified Streptomyces TaxID=2593676 RepID=UPI0033BF0EC5
MLVALKKTVGLVTAAILALGAVAVATPSGDTEQGSHQIVADHQGPAVVTP